MRPGSTVSSVRTALNTAEPTPEDMVHSAPYMSLHHAGGRMVSKTITIAGTGAEVVTNLFIIACNCELMALYGTFKDVSNVAVATGCYFDLWDGANSVPLTADGADCSGVAVSSMIVKTADDATVAALANANQCRYNEDAAFREAFFGGVMTANSGATTYLRFRVDTNGVTDCEIEFTCVWTHRCDNALVTAA